MLTLITTVPVLPSKIKVTAHVMGLDQHLTITETKAGGDIQTEIPLTFQSNHKVVIGVEFGDQHLTKGVVLFRDNQNNLVVGYYHESKYYTVGMDPEQFRQLLMSSQTTSFGVLYGGFQAKHRIRLGALWLVGYQPPLLGETYREGEIALSKGILEDTIGKLKVGALDYISNIYPSFAQERVHSLFCGFLFTLDRRAKIVIGRLDRVMDITDIIGFPSNADLPKPLSSADEVLQEVVKPTKEPIVKTALNIILPHRHGKNWVSPIIGQSDIDKLVNQATESRLFDTICRSITHQKMDKRKSAGLYAFQNFGEYGRYLIGLSTMRNLMNICGTSPTLRLRGDGYELLYTNTDKVVVYIRQYGVTPINETPKKVGSVEIPPNPRLEHLTKPDIANDTQELTQLEVEYGVHHQTGEPCFVGSECYPDVELLVENAVNDDPDQSAVETTTTQSHRPVSVLDVMFENMQKDENHAVEHPGSEDVINPVQVEPDPQLLEWMKECRSDIPNTTFHPPHSKEDPEWLTEVLASPMIGSPTCIHLDRVPLHSRNQAIFKLPEPYGNRVLWTDITDDILNIDYFREGWFVSYMNMSFYRIGGRVYATEMHINLGVGHYRDQFTIDSLPEKVDEFITIVKSLKISEGDIMTLVVESLYK